MQRLYPTPAADLDPDAIYDDLRDQLPKPPAGRPYTMLNMVTSVDGKAAVRGKAAPLGSDLDHRLMRAIRAANDAVLNGAGTLRAEGIDSRVGAAWGARRAARGLPAQPLTAVVTRAGDLPLDRGWFRHEGIERVVLAGAGLAADPDRHAALAARARVILAPTPEPEPAWIARTLREACGVRYLLVEGGPHLNGALIAAGLVDEICWTLAPKIAGGGERLTLVEGPALPGLPPLALASAYLHEDELFLRYRFAGPRAAG